MARHAFYHKTCNYTTIITIYHNNYTIQQHLLINTGGKDNVLSEFVGQSHINDRGDKKHNLIIHIGCEL